MEYSFRYATPAFCSGKVRKHLQFSLQKFYQQSIFLIQEAVG
jgi:hypothetical protein